VVITPFTVDFFAIYRIARKFGEEFNLANWQGIEKIAKLKIAKF